MVIHTDQASDSIDRQVHGDQYIPFSSWNSCNKTSIDFGQNTNDVIYVNPLRTIGSIIPQINSMKSGTGIGFGDNSGDGIPPRNIGSFGLFNRGNQDFVDRSASWNGASKSESENSEGGSNLKNAGRENTFEVKIVEYKNLYF